ncbi:MAG: hypothetical protein HY370_03435 [Proteobacteria bacterium]|nr:hypothetical protein [Pseudomonadota bacterium]
MSASENVSDLSNVVEGVNEKLLKLETFVARRFDELSMEVNATSQLVDMAEEGLRRHFMEILEVLKAINFHGEGSSPANAGVELDAVVKITEEAANQILDSADNIVNLLGEGKNWTDEKTRDETIAKINDRIQLIMTACSFQDLTGQKIRTTIANLKLVEERLSTTLAKLGINITESELAKVEKSVEAGSSQDDIDALFGTE